MTTLAIIAAAALAAGPTPDLNGDGLVDGADQGILLGAWSPRGTAPNHPADLNGDHTVNGADLGLLLGAWSPTTTVTATTVTDALHGNPVAVPAGATTTEHGTLRRYEWATPKGVRAAYLKVKP